MGSFDIFGPGSQFNQSPSEKFSLDYALQRYDNSTKYLRDQITANASLDAISKDDLISMLDSGIQTTRGANTDNAKTFDEITLGVIAQVQTALDAKAKARSDASKAAQDAQQQSLQNTPGRNQTILTQRTTTPSGTPTLITGK